jgi:hypothetical protein
MTQQQLVTTEDFAKDAGADVIAGSLTGAKVKLLKETVELSPTVLLADLVAAEADYTGYAEAAVTWSAVTRGDDGVIEFLGTVPEFRPTGTVLTNAIFGLFVVDALEAVVYMVAAFEGGPLPMESALDSIRLTLRYRPDSKQLVAFIS